MISDHDIARWRLRSQHLVRPHAGSVVGVVAHLLAVQAENPSQSAWAVASRTSDPSPGELRSALQDGRVIRTHVLRPTWHYVRAEDIGWLLELTAPRVRQTTSKQLQAVHGLDARLLERVTSEVVEIVGEQPGLTRGQIAESLRSRGVHTDGGLMTILLAHLELDRLVCSGRPFDDEHTYVLFADRVPKARRLDRSEALAELALRYFSGHGPATERDLAYWATLTLTDVRHGLNLVNGQLASFEHEGRTFWHAPADPPRRRGEPTAHLLQILDETYRGYQDTRWVLDAAAIVPRARESSAGMALVDAQLLAATRRMVTSDRVVFELTPYRSLDAKELAALQRAAKRYGRYLDLVSTLELSQRGRGRS
ncbi:MAG TPA: winged helix DNA-binding domain-containing protein [Actinomycetota bacterium]|nr:winged helix DNA-binding domain-containing protein [Actinomycetota bacterium]